MLAPTNPVVFKTTLKEGRGEDRYLCSSVRGLIKNNRKIRACFQFVSSSFVQGCSNKGKEASHRKIQLGWLHFDTQKKKFVSVRLLKAGGTTTVSVELTNVKDFNHCAKIHFLP